MANIKVKLVKPRIPIGLVIIIQVVDFIVRQAN